MTIQADYNRLSSDRSPYLQRARDASKYTLPWLVPAEGASGSTRLRVTYSSFGARCVNSLATKLLLAIFPPRSFFRLSVTKKLEEQLGGPKMKADIDKALASIEETVLEEINATPTRTPAGEAFKHLLVAGNVLVYIQPEGGIKHFPLSQYVVKRDKAGNPLWIIVQEKVSLLALPEAIRPVIEGRLKSQGKKAADFEDNLTIYTSVKRAGGQWIIRQEVESIFVPGSMGTYPEDACPWLPLRWIPDTTGPYGRGLVEDYLGHLISLESLSASLVKATAIAAKVVFLRNPNGTVSAKKLTQAETGDVIDGKKDEVTVVSTEKQADMATARQTIQDLKDELAFAFALNQAVQRNAERVTAEEIRYMAQELDATLGGNYSTLSMEFQLPYLRRVMLQLEKAGKLPRLPKGAVRPVIVTGLDALGRGADLDNLKAFVNDVVELGGPEALNEELNFGDLLKRLSVARGIQTEGLIKSPEEKLAAQQANQQQQLLQALGPNAVNAFGGMAKQAMANGAAPQPTT